MDNFLSQIFNLLTAPPGNLIYHLVIAFSIGSALQANLSYTRDPNNLSPRRITLGLSVLLAIQAVMFLVSGLAWQGIVNPQILLPPIDRAANAFAVVWIIWLWAFPKPVRWADSLFILLNLVVAVSLAFTLSIWSTETSTPFNNTWLDTGWEVFSLAIVLIGSALLLIRRPSGWPIGMGMLAVLLIGYLFQVLVFYSGDFPGFVRLAQLAAFPLLFALPERSPVRGEAPIPAQQTSAQAENKTDKPIVKERRRYSADPKTVHAFLSLAIESNPKNMVMTVTRAIGQAMLSDLCLLSSAPDNSGQFAILGGYDLIREESLEGVTLSRDDVPVLATSIQKGRPLRLPASHATSPDIKTLYEVIGLANPGNLMAVPLIGQNQAILGGILLLSPYSNRVWSADDQTYLTNAAEQLALILYRPLPASQPAPVSVEQNTDELNRVKNDLETSRQQIGQMEKVQKDLTEQLVAVQKRASAIPQNDTLQALLEVQEEAQDLIAQLQTENENLRLALSQASPTSVAKDASQPTAKTSQDFHYMEEELHKSLADVAQLQNKLAVSNARIVDLEKQSEGTPGSTPRIQPEQNTAILMVLEELRRPVSSMVGQIDHLVQEPGSENKETQAKSLDRMKASVERILGLLDDLVEIIAVPENGIELSAEEIDVNGLIDLVLATSAAEFRDKNLALQVDLPDKLPLLNADRRATQKTLALLLNNATAVTPTAGVIRLKVRLQGENTDQPFLLFQVTDSGGGIASVDLPRLFSRFESASDQPISGLGAPKNLAEARDLVEAQNGRIWVDTEPGASATFSFLLPLVQARIVDDIIDE